MDRLRAVLTALGDDKEKLVIDLSCRRKDDRWFVATNKWQTITDFELDQGASQFVRNTSKGALIQFHREHPPPRTLLLRISDPRCRRRGSAARHRSRAGRQARRVV